MEGAREAGTLEGLKLEVDEAANDPKAALGPKGPLEALRTDLERLGPFDILLLLFDELADDEPFGRELHASLARRIAESVPDDVRAELGGAAPLGRAAEAFLARKGARGPQSLRKIVENHLFEYYDLRDHGLFVDDVVRTLDLLGAVRPGAQINDLFQQCARITRTAAKFLLGLFPEQTFLIFRIDTNDATRKDIDDAIAKFQPAALWRRLFPMLRTLLEQEKRARLALILYGQMRGYRVTRPHIETAFAHLAVEGNEKLIRRALEKAARRGPYLERRAAWAPDIDAFEAIYAGTKGVTRSGDD